MGPFYLSKLSEEQKQMLRRSAAEAPKVLRESESYGRGPIAAHIDAVKNGEMEKPIREVLGESCEHTRGHCCICSMKVENRDYIASLSKDDQLALYQYMHNVLGLRIY